MELCRARDSPSPLPAMASVLRATVVTAVRVADAADLAAQKLVDETFQNRSLWTLKSIMSTAGMGKFSTDRT